MSRQKTGFLAAAAACVLCVGLAQPVLADDHKHEHELREKTMKAMGGGMKATGGFLKGEVEADELKEKVGKLAAAAATDPQKVFFPKDAHAGEGDSHVKAALWTEWPKAEGMWKDVGTAAAALNAAVMTGDKGAIAAAFKATGAACTACHDAYRIKKD